MNSNSAKPKKLPIISMAKAVELLGIRVYGKDGDAVPTDVADINVLCPKCGAEHSNRRLTLNIDFAENVFSCPRCGFSGGVYHLISFYTGWPVRNVEGCIRAGKLQNFKPNENISNLDISSASVSRTEMSPLAPIKQRNEVYRALQDMLTLSATHHDNLRSRGLSEAAIQRIGFRSYPKYLSANVIPQRLINKGLDLRGVPGFGINENGEWSLARLPDSGFLIPNFSGDGRIQGYQVRFDHPNASIPKYGYLTSKGMRAGTKCETWCCWSGRNFATDPTPNPFDVILIEGPLKALIVNDITGCNAISVPGVSALKKVPAALQSMVQFGLREVLIAYDMDSDTNKDVRAQLERLREILDNINIKHRTMRWDPAYKGLDDWLVGSKDAPYKR